MSELVSILIPCYNAERWISQAIESALAQTWIAKEVVVVDDGSTDRSLDIVGSFGERIRVDSSTHRGGNDTRNRLLDLARGEWVQYLDADDYLLPDKVARQMEFLATHLESDVVFGPVMLEHWSQTDARRELLPIAEPHDLWVLLARWELPQTGAPLWRKQAIRDVGGWKHDQPCCQEHELYLRLLIAGKRFAYCPASGAVYRQWSTTTVCKRDTPEVHRRRLTIEQSLEDHLRARKQLTPERLRAISQARFETARSAWQHDRAFAQQIMHRVRETDPRFWPVGAAAPATYRLAFRWLGFQNAEVLADIKRKFVSTVRRATTPHRRPHEQTIGIF